ncbi:hypothetical protein O9X98_08930 [Agrobacterium salinitolerans]|nr:hypothetical protein [Agrobacterium salinitolerans]
MVRKTVKGKFVSHETSFDAEGKITHALLVFRADNGKRYNICGSRFDLVGKRISDLIRIFAPVNDPLKKLGKLTLDDGEITKIKVGTEEMALPAALFPDYPADIFAFKQCLNDIVEKLKFLDLFVKMVTNLEARQAVDPRFLVDTYSSYPRDCFEVLALQYRRVCELLFHSCWAANEKRLNLPVDAWQLSRFDTALAEVEPNYFLDPLGYNKESLSNLKDWGLKHDDVISLYKECGEYLHTPSLYKKSGDIVSFVKSTQPWREKLIRTLSFGRVKFDDDNFLYYRYDTPRNRFYTWTDTGKMLNTPAEVEETLERWAARHRAR